MKAMIQELEEPDAQMPAATVSNFTGSVRFTYMWYDDHKYVEHIYIIYARGGRFTHGSFSRILSRLSR